MENILSGIDESYDLGYQASPSSLDQSDQSANGTPLSGDSFAHRRTSSEASFSESLDDQSYSSEPSPSFWPGSRSGGNRQNQALLARVTMKQSSSDKLDFHEASDTELDLMKERFAKLLLGEDMSGSGKGVCTAVTISNTITNLYATVFGQNLRLEPLNPEKRALWKREMDCLLSVCDHIVEFVPVTHDSEDGNSMEIMSSRPRADIYMNLPALRKLDTMLIEILDSFEETEFWYAEQGSMSSSSMKSGSFRRIAERKDEKWWLPVPCVPSKGLSENERKHLRHNRDCANQIHKAAMAINTTILAEMEIPDSYMETLPKSGRACLGDTIYKSLCSGEKFSAERLLEQLSLASEHEALELADRVESSMYTWRRKACLSNSKSSWDMVKDLMSDTDRTDKNHLLAERAETFLFTLKLKFPELSQTSLDACKIQYNKDVGQAVLESYSRVLEGFAFNLVAWIEDVIFVDRAARTRDHQE